MTHHAITPDCNGLLLTAIAMNEAALDGDIEELRFLIHLLVADARVVAPNIDDIMVACNNLMQVLGPVGEKPIRDFVLPLHVLTEAVHVACSQD